MLSSIKIMLQVEPKKKLTAEEAAEQAEALRKRIKAKNQVLHAMGCITYGSMPYQCVYHSKLDFFIIRAGPLET